jgi:hypothetical protein
LGGPKGTSRIYKSTMQQSRHHCVALYLKEEYEKLAVEAHNNVKCPKNLLEIKLLSNSYSASNVSKTKTHCLITK